MNEYAVSTFYVNLNNIREHPYYFISNTIKLVMYNGQKL
jgi:hypothetical protein